MLILVETFVSAKPNKAIKKINSIQREKGMFLNALLFLSRKGRLVAGQQAESLPIGDVMHLQIGDFSMGR